MSKFFTNFTCFSLILAVADATITVCAGIAQKSARNLAVELAKPLRASHARRPAWVDEAPNSSSMNALYRTVRSVLEHP
jgi:hypothetical protein